MSRYPPVKSFRDLIAWQKAMDLTVLAYDLSKQFPSTERYSLTQQIRRSTSSVAANIAEGHGRRSVRDNLRFVSIALGSLNESETLLELAGRLDFVTAENLARALNLSKEVGRILVAFRRSLIRKVN